MWICLVIAGLRAVESGHGLRNKSEFQQLCRLRNRCNRNLRHQALRIDPRRDWTLIRGGLCEKFIVRNGWGEGWHVRLRPVHAQLLGSRNQKALQGW